VTAAALLYAEGEGPQPKEIILAWNIERYGVQAVMGRPYLGVSEIRAMNAATGVYDAYRSREAYRDKDGNKNWPEWANKYPALARMLVQAERAAADGE
jgi:hypothetical protein